MIVSAGAGASAAAAAARRRMQKEEEEMTNYRPEDLSGDWQFKILRSPTGAFGNPGKLQRALEEEALAGWVMVEKFDNGRIRLKRPASARANDGALGFDPYRTYAGITETRFALLVVALVLGVFLLAVLVAVIMANI
jgi:hypothetical protein